jgi:hypothetical protein
MRFTDALGRHAPRRHRLFSRPSCRSLTPVSTPVARGPPKPEEERIQPMHTTSVDSTNLPHLRDVDGTPIPFQGRVHQAEVDEEHGAQPFRLHTQGHAIGRGVPLLYVRFSDDTVAIRPDLVRVVPTTPEGG